MLEIRLKSSSDSSPSVVSYSGKDTGQYIQDQKVEAFVKIPISVSAAFLPSDRAAL